MCCNGIINPLIKGDFVPERRSGHVSIFYNGLLIVFGGYYDDDERGVRRDNGEIDVEDYLPSNNLWFYNVEASTWKNNITKGEDPGKLVGSCACVVQNKLYLFGGFHKEDFHTNKLFSLDLASLIWHNLTHEVEGFQPSPRDKFGCCSWREKITFFGGFGTAPLYSMTKGDFIEDDNDLNNDHVGWNNQLHVLDCSDKLNWSQPDCSGDIPCPRAAFAYTQINKFGYLLGGRFQDVRRSDMYCLDLDTYLWKRIDTRETTPCGRSWHVMAPVSDHHLFIYGGIDNIGNTLDDVWIYNIEENIWTELEDATSNLNHCALRLWHTVSNTDYDGEILIFGGCSSLNFFRGDSSVHTNLVSIFRFSPLPLKRLCADKIASKSEQ